MTETHMKRVLIAALFAVLGVIAFFAVPARTDALINPQINFQGKLTNADGTNVTDGNYSIVFSIYSASSGGTAIWTETQGTVAVSSGIFQVSLGSGTALPGSVDFTSGSLYLGVKVGSDAEMTPRIRFTAAPYAFNASTADNATQLGGIASSGYVQLSPSAQQGGNINISGNITAAGTYNGNTFTGSSLQFSSAVSSSIQGANSQAFNVDSGSSGSLALGASNASGITLGKFGTTTTTAGTFTVNSGTNVPAADQVVIDNTSSSGVAIAGVNGLNVKYKGGAAAVEAAAVRVDYAPGSTTGGAWSGVRIVANAIGPVSGVTAYGIKLEGPTTQGAGTEKAVYVGTGWDIGVDVQSGGLQLAAQTDPAAPAAGNLRIYAKDIAGRVMPKWIGPSGVDTPFQASFGFNRIAMMTPQNGTTATTIMSEWGGGYTNTGNAYSTPALATTNLLSSVRRARITTNALAGNIAAHYPASLMAWRGNASGLGGFFFTTRVGFIPSGASNRAFAGLVDVTTVPTNVDPTTTTTPGKIGIGFNANTGNMKLINNVTGTAPTSLDLGANFPVSTTALYELVLFSAPNGSSIGYRVTNLSTGNQTSGSLTTNIPSNTTFLAPQMWISNNGTATAASIDSAGWYLESDE